VAEDGGRRPGGSPRGRELGGVVSWLRTAATDPKGRSMRRASAMRTVTAPMVALGLTLAACGGDDDEPKPETTTTLASTTTTTLAPTTTTSPPGQTTTTARPVTLRCKTVGFTPGTEDAASSVTATGLPCSEAESFVRVAGRQTSPGGPQQVDVQGYRCVRTQSKEEPLPQAFYTCTNGPKKVSFVRT